jgi:ATP synthase protein I
MTTAPPPSRPGHRPALVGAAVRSAFVGTLAAGLATAAVASVAAGGAAAAGALAGTAMVCVFFGFGAVVLNVVAALTPAISLLVALLTYTLQVTLMGVVLLALRRSGALVSAVDARWLAGAVIGGTLVWLGGQIYAHKHSREPLYDLAPTQPQAGAR